MSSTELTLSQANVYLASRVRKNTPFGAIEYLACVQHREPEVYRARVQLALDCLEIYQSLFPEEYSRSDAPPFSLQVEQEFYQLIHYKVFPLMTGPDMTVVDSIREQPFFFLPFIPLRGTQEHCWWGGQFDFAELQTVYKLAQVLSGLTGKGGRGWEALRVFYGLSGVPEPAPPLAAVGWSLFNYACRVDESPLKYLPLAFHMITYDTGNAWLDSRQGVGHLGFDWSAREIARLCVMWQQARQMEIAIKAVDNWLDHDPRARIAQVIKLWNDAAQKERTSGYEGMLVPDLVEAGAVDLGNNLCVMTMEAAMANHLLEGIE